MTLDLLLQSIDSDLSSGKLVAPEKWLDRSFFLSGFLEQEQIEEARLESTVAEAVNTVNLTFEKPNMARAEKMVIGGHQSWKDWRAQQAKVKKIENYIAAAKRHASRMY